MFSTVSGFKSARKDICILLVIRGQFISKIIYFPVCNEKNELWIKDIKQTAKTVLKPNTILDVITSGFKVKIKIKVAKLSYRMIHITSAKLLDSDEIGILS